MHRCSVCVCAVCVYTRTGPQQSRDCTAAASCAPPCILSVKTLRLCELEPIGCSPCAATGWIEKGRGRRWIQIAFSSCCCCGCGATRWRNVKRRCVSALVDASVNWTPYTTLYQQHRFVYWLEQCTAVLEFRFFILKKKGKVANIRCSDAMRCDDSRLSERRTPLIHIYGFARSMML